MSENKEEQFEINELCRKIESIRLADHLSDEQKLAFARATLQIVRDSQDMKELL
ncbi:MAG: hypothetical protein SGJ02_10515 [bacterium]|nr:hypothetical protein [bacterium]